MTTVYWPPTWEPHRCKVCEALTPNNIDICRNCRELGYR